METTKSTTATPPANSISMVGSPNPPAGGGGGGGGFLLPIAPLIISGRKIEAISDAISALAQQIISSPEVVWRTMK